MSRAKEELVGQDSLYLTAQGIAVEAKAIEECEYHSGTYLSCDDQDAEKMAYAIGTNKTKRGELNFKREELMDAIKTAISDAGEECYSCEKWKRS